jgi:tRNA dimethylallyltransferase
MKKIIIAITGPSAAGKSALAVKLALFIKRKFKNIKGAEIISADSRQIYKNLKIGTNIPSKREQKLVPHHLINFLDVKQKISVNQFKKKAEQIIKKMWKEQKIPIICGGSGFYWQAITDGFIFPNVPPNKKLRKELNKKTCKELSLILKKYDKKRWKKIDKKNKKRLIRAIEIAQKLGSVPLLKKRPLTAQILKLGLNIPKEKLKKNIEKRTKLMLRKGLIKEGKYLISRKMPAKEIKELGFEYWNVIRYLNGEIANQKELQEIINKNTIRYIKRQLTWFKKDKKIIWIENQKKAYKLTESFLLKKI